MNNKTIKILITFILTLLILSIFYPKVNAASMSISASKGTVSPGETFSVTVSVSNGAGSVNLSVSNGSLSSTSTWLDNSSASFTCTAGSSGSVKISATGNFADYSTGEDEPTKYGSTTVTIQSPSNNNSNSGESSNSGGGSSSNSTKKSNNNNNNKTKETEKEVKKSDIATLESLSIEDDGFVIEPEFSADIYDYTIKVPNEIMQLNIKANPTDAKATVEISGNENFVVGENNVLVKVTAEDGTTQTYTIKVIKEREKLALKTLKIKYKDEEGNIIDLALTPEFIFDTYEYTLEEISYKVNELLVECEANLEGAKIEVTGNNNLQAGENEITIKITIPAELDHELQEGEEKPEDEVITYKIKFNKEQTPTFWQKIKNKIKAIFGTIKDKYDNNKKQITLVGLAVCIGAMLILSVYIAIDAKKYKTLIQKLEKLSAINTAETAGNSNNIEEIYKDKNINENDNLEKNDAKGSSKGGRHF